MLQILYILPFLKFLSIESLVALLIIIIILYIYYNKKDQYPIQKELYHSGISGFSEILNELKFCSRYDKDRFIKLNEKFETFAKTYVHILGERWNIQQSISHLVDLRIEILEILYSYYVVLPTEMKNVFGFKPLEKLKENIDRFHNISYVMIKTCQNFGKHKLNVVHFEDIRLISDMSRNNFMLP